MTLAKAELHKLIHIKPRIGTRNLLHILKSNQRLKNIRIAYGTALKTFDSKIKG